MICIISGNYKEAAMWARGQELHNDEWFYPLDEDDLKRRKDFHVVVIGTAGDNVPAGYFERVYQLAKSRGRMK
jgi:hypothetical protein